MDSCNLEWDEFLLFTCYYYNMFPSSSSTECPFFHMFGWDKEEGHLTHLNNSNRYYGTNEGKIILQELHKLWKHHTTQLRELHQRNEYEMNLQTNKLLEIIKSLKVARQLWSRTMDVIILNQNMYWITEYWKYLMQASSVNNAKWKGKKNKYMQC